MSDTRADTTSMGLFLISFIMLVFGLVGIFGYQQSENLGLADATGPMMFAVGILFAFCGYAAWKNDNKFLMIIFAFLALFSVTYSQIGTGGQVEGIYFYYIVVAIFFIVFALWALLGKAGFMLTALLIVAGLVFLFFALAVNQGVGTDDAKTFMLLMGIFAFIGFLISVYMALADVTDLGLPVM